jgi:4-amino-4-deoxy-L-arabinose transferase-like glycosyltransferase
MASKKEESVEQRKAAGGIGPWPLLLLLLILFAASVAFVIPSFSKYHGDERFYTDAALRMTATGDYWTPYFASGKIRLLKPIVTYWAIAGSFKTFGVSLAASRAPSLCAGLLSIALVFYLGKTLFNSARVGLLSAALLASNIEFLVLSARATPDALVTLFSLVAMTGFAIVWFGEGRSLKGPMLAWCGIGLAVQTKGLLGLCPVVACAVFLAVARPPDVRARAARLFDWRALPPGILLATFWYVVMFRLHGASALRDFFDDQVGAKVSLSLGFILKNMLSYLTAGLRHFLPWTLAACVWGFLWRKEVREFWNTHRAKCVFLLVLFPMLVLVFSFGNMRAGRYVMISYPPLSALIAVLLDRFLAAPGFERVLRRGVLVAGVVALAVAVALLAFGAQYTWRVAAASSFLCAIGVSGVLLRRRLSPLALCLWVAALVISLHAVFDGAIRSVSTPTPFAAMASQIFEARPGTSLALTYKVEETAASQLRLAAGGRLQVRPAQKTDLESGANILLTTAEGRKAEAVEAAWLFSPVALSPETIRVRDALNKFRRTKDGRNTAGRNTEYYIGIPRSRAGE